MLTSTPPFYECKCKEPFQPPNCRKGKYDFAYCVCNITGTIALDDIGESDLITIFRSYGPLKINEI